MSGLDELEQNLQEILQQALQQDDLENVLEIIVAQLRSANVYLSYHEPGDEISGLRLGYWRWVDDAQDLVLTDNRIRYWLGDDYDRTYSNSSLASDDIVTLSPSPSPSPSEELTPGQAHIAAIVGHAPQIQHPIIQSPEDVRQMLAHTPIPAATTPSPSPPLPPTQPTYEDLEQAARFLLLFLLVAVALYILSSFI